MELKEVIGRRRTIRFFLPHRPVEREKIQKMLEAARHSSCVGNVMNVRGVVIWRDQASESLLKALTPPLGYQQMQTAPVFIFWYNERAAYQIDKWIDDLYGLVRARRIGTSVEGTIAEIDKRLKPIFSMGWEASSVSPLAFMDMGLAIAQATLVAYDEGLGTCMMSSPRIERIGKMLNLPETAVPVAVQAVGYPAESWEAGGQTPKPPLGELFHEMSHGQPFEADPAVAEELKDARMCQDTAPLPWRDAELQYLIRALGLEDRILAVEFGT
ncbi:MAG: nitroreductase family protein [Thermoflexaceae bacterium]|nr:nitroreductase family protein [Thermoflexaceae bacterium]